MDRGVIDDRWFRLLSEYSDGVDAIARERWRQIQELGFSAEHDDEHVTETRAGGINSDLLLAASAYLQAGMERLAEAASVETLQGVPPGYWPWDEADWKPSGDPIKNLTKAGALIAAEIDRQVRGKSD